jgi:hypothetical protein
MRRVAGVEEVPNRPPGKRPTDVAGCSGASGTPMPTPSGSVHQPERPHEPPCPGQRRPPASPLAHKSGWMEGPGHIPHGTTCPGVRSGTQCCRCTRPTATSGTTGGDDLW